MSRLGRYVGSVVFAVATAVAAGSGPAGAATPPASIPFEVCSPLGCAQQSVTGTAEVGSSSTLVRAKATDRAVTYRLSVTLRVVDASGAAQQRSFTVDDGTQTVTTTFSIAAVKLQVTACAAPLGACNSRSIPLT